MAFAQTNYQEKVGNGPYTIAQIGCFLTAFCNLAQRFGIAIDPPTLNNVFIKYGDYLADPSDGAGVKDDLSWHSITSAESSIVVTGEGGAGWPGSDNAIVKFEYPENGETMTHFCLVADHNAQTIVDSWDGVIKGVGKYGQPVAWATYGLAVVQPVHVAVNTTPAVPEVPAPAPTPAPTAPNSITINVEPGWGLERIAAAAGRTDAAHPSTWQLIAQANGSNDWQTFNEHLQPNQKVIVPLQGGHGDGEDFEVKIPASDDGEKIPVKVTNWQDTFQAFLSPQRYVSKDTIEVQDIDDDEKPQPDQALYKGQVVQVAGQFTRDGVAYYRSTNSVAKGVWYGIPVTDLVKVGSDEELNQILDTMHKEEATALKSVGSSSLVGKMFHKTKKG